MSRETEKILKELYKAIEGKEYESDEAAQAEIDAIVEKYNNGLKSNVTPMKKSADDYLDMAYDADTEEKAIEYAEKALKLDPHLIDARLLLLRYEDEAEYVKKQLEDVIKGETKRLEKESYFEADAVGRFWGMLETRPYMRARAAYVELLIEMGKIKKAASECEDILRLCESDNMGMRYKLMTLYAYLEDADSARDLSNKYKENSFSMLFPMAILYYKLDDLVKAEKILKKILKSNEDYKAFLAGELELDEDKIEKVLSEGMYRPGTIEEVLSAIEEDSILSVAIVYFNEWACDVVWKN